jgi:protein-S-isoprenylcysteine O-methyltransferase Ste14
MRVLELKIPPPILAVPTVAAMLGLWWLHACPLPNPYPFLSAVLPAIIGTAFLLPSLIHFRKAKTTILPHCPEKATHLVVTGMYRYSRNPMYVGGTLLLLALAILLDDALALLPVPFYAVWLNYFQIIPEERALEQLFGDEYREYKSRVRRWI